MPDEELPVSALQSYNILHTPTAPEFDDIVHLACQSCNAPIGFVGFLSSDRQWFKARIGLAKAEIPLDHSICAVAVASGRDVFVVHDLAADPLTKDNPLVSGPPGLRYYAGAVLRTPRGEALGTVCVLDTVPRPDGLAPDEAASLQALARLTMILLELHRAMGLGYRAAGVNPPE